MDLNNIGEAENRISELPDSILHHILSFLDIKPVAQTGVLSKGWKYLWTSIPTLVFPYFHSERLSLFETNKFMEFVDTTLHLHDGSNIQKFHLKTNKHMSASRVHSWIENLIRNNVEELNLWLDHDKPFFIPLSLSTCESLIKLELIVNDATHLPTSFCCPKLRSLKLSGIRFTDDYCWNEQHFSNCPVLGSLTLEYCTWFDVRIFCISIPTLKFLEIYNLEDTEDGLQNCSLKIDAPNLVSLVYCGSVAKEYVLSSFRPLEFAEVYLGEYHGVQWEQPIGYGAAVSQFFRALSCVQCLEIYPETLETLSMVDNFVNILPRVFRDLVQLILKEGVGETTDKSLFLLLKAVPNLRSLVFEESCIDDNREEEHSWAGHMLTSGRMFQHLETVNIARFSGNARQMRWVKLILKTANALKAVTLSLRSGDAINKEALMSDLRSLPRGSDGLSLSLKSTDY